MFLFRIQYRQGHLFVCAQKVTCLGIKGRLRATAFTYPHLTHKVLSLSVADLPNVPFLRVLL
jgi:hypothetical protein